MTKFVLELLRTIESPEAADWVVTRPNASRIEDVLDARGTDAPSRAIVASILSGQKWPIAAIRQLYCEIFLRATPPRDSPKANIIQRLRAMAEWHVRWPESVSQSESGAEKVVWLVDVMLASLPNDPLRTLGAYMLLPGGNDRYERDTFVQLTAFLSRLSENGFSLPQDDLALPGPATRATRRWRDIKPREIVTSSVSVIASRKEAVAAVSAPVEQRTVKAVKEAASLPPVAQPPDTKVTEPTKTRVELIELD